MNKIYGYNLFNRTATFFFFLLGCYLLIDSYYTHNFKLLVFCYIYTPLALYYSILNLYVVVEIGMSDIKVSSLDFIPPRKLAWSDIEAIIDDSPFPRLQFTHIYHLMPKRVFSEKPKKRIIITTYFRNYRDLLKEIVQRVSPGTKVDPSILKLTNLTQEDIGKL